MPLMLTPARDITHNGILTGRPMNVLTLLHSIFQRLHLDCLNKHLAMSVDLRLWSISHVSFHTLLLASATSVTFLGPHQDNKPAGPKKPKALVGNAQALHGLAPKCKLINMYELINKSTNDYIILLHCKNGANVNNKG